MTSRRIQGKPENDDYRRLARYIADANHERKKCLGSWTVVCWMGEDCSQAIREAQALNALSTQETSRGCPEFCVNGSVRG